MDPKTFWDDKFRHARYAYGTAPNAYLAAEAHRFAPGARVLALGEGEGRNAVWLAEQGLAVTAIDASGMGLAKLAALAAERGVTVAAHQDDVRTRALGTAAWDAIYNVYCHLAPEDRAALYPRIREAIAPGGHFLSEQFSIAQLDYRSGGPKDVALLMTLGELASAFADWELLVAEEAVVTLDEGPLHQGPAAVVRFLARKPQLG